MSKPTGKAYLIGAGPGDPGLLTLRGQRRLAEADLVIYDYLVNPRILQWARAGAELVCLGRHGHGRIVEQQEINDRMIAAAAPGAQWSDSKAAIRLFSHAPPKRSPHWSRRACRMKSSLA